MARHNTRLDRVGKQYLPEGFDLAVDRSKEAEEVTTKVSVWKDKTNRMDLKGFDTPDAREARVSSVVKDIKGIAGRTTSGEDAILEEPERFVRPDQKAGNLLHQHKDEIYNFESFKRTLKKSWSGDPALPNLMHDLHREDILRLIYQTNTVQNWIRQNSDDLLTHLVQKRYNVEENRARKILQGLDSGARDKLLTSTRVRFRAKPVTVMKAKRKVVMIKQVSKGGKVYERSKPKKWTVLENKLVSNNRAKKVSHIFDIYRKVFHDTERSDSSIRNKIYRVR